MNMKLYGIAAAVMLALATAAQAQTTTAPSTPRADPTDRGTVRDSTMNHKVKEAEGDRIEADYKAAKAHCETMKGNAKDVCVKEAKGKEKVAKAERERAKAAMAKRNASTGSSSPAERSNAGTPR